MCLAIVLFQLVDRSNDDVITILAAKPLLINSAGGMPVGVCLFRERLPFSARGSCSFSRLVLGS